MPQTEAAQMFSFLKQLAANNNRGWFEENKAAFLDAKKVAGNLVDACIEAVSKEFPLGELDAGRCMFRIYRDVRFSKNKDPYKTNFAALIAPGGRKSESVFSWYLHLEPGNSFMASGLYEPSAEQLARIRQEIVYNAEAFRTLLKDASPVFGEIQGNRLKTAPKSYPKDHPEIEFLRLTQFYFMKKYSDEVVCQTDFAKLFAADGQKLLPFLEFLKQALD